MGNFFWYLAGYALLIGYLRSVLSCVFDGPNDKWWKPLVYGAVLPFWWIGDHREDIALGVVLCSAVVLFFTLAKYLSGLCSRIWGML